MAQRSAVSEQFGGRVKISENKVKTAILVIVENCDSTAVLDLVGSVYPANLGKSPVSIISEQDVSFAPAETMRADIEQETVFCSEASTDAFHHL